jgi:hypothetical protein
MLQRPVESATDACIEVWGANRVGMHLAPRGDVGTMGDSDAAATFGYVARELDKRTSAFIAACESLGDKRLGPQLKAAFSGPYIANEKFTRESAQQVLHAGEAGCPRLGSVVYRDQAEIIPFNNAAVDIGKHCIAQAAERGRLRADSRNEEWPCAGWLRGCHDGQCAQEDRDGHACPFVAIIDLGSWQGTIRSRPFHRRV